nr:hypothetical protein BaRGS_022734 [Batillaria attramentaria]
MFSRHQTAADAPWTETVKEAPASENGTSQVNANTVLEKLEDYVKLSRNDFPVPDSDHVMLFTGLGAKHDGQENSCNSADRYVMAGSGLHPETEANKRNPWHFSSCSVDYFNTHLNFMVTEGFEDSCLLKQSTADGVPTVSGLPGQRSGPDEQCQMIYGNESYLCRRQGRVYQDKTCNDMPSGNCYDKNFRKVCCEMCDKSVTGVPG